MEKDMKTPCKKICFIALGNLYLTPYMNKYIAAIDCGYDIVYWNRHGVIEKTKANTVYPYERRLEEGASLLQKALGYLGFTLFAARVLKKNRYSGVVALSTGVGMLLYPLLHLFYRDRYIIDVRDYTMEKKRLYFAIEKRLIKGSAAAVISSEGFKSFLPKHDYLLSHNSVNLPEAVTRVFRSKNKKQQAVITISAIGLIRFFDESQRVIEKFKNDPRFEVSFFGRGAMKLENYCREQEITNVRLEDAFPPEETIGFYRRADIINNLYGSNSIELDYALSNKLYYAAALGLPVLVCPGTYMETVSKQYGFGYTFDFDSPTAGDDLFHYYISMDWEVFYKACDAFLERVKVDDALFERAVRKFAGGE